MVLWTRLADFDPEVVGTALTERTLVRLPLMRSTIHLVTAADALALRPLAQIPIEGSTLGQCGRHLRGIDRAELVATTRRLVDEQPLIASELGRRLAEDFPGSDQEALAQGARAWLPMVQVPPRGVWGRSGRALQAPLESWLGRSVRPMPMDRLVTRYLAAFGPATVRDMQTWCGLTKLAEVVEAIRPDLMTLHRRGRPRGLRPTRGSASGSRHPAPVRFLYDYDNLLLSHADRSRVVLDVDYAAHGYTAESNRQPSSLLVDGFVAGTWTVTRQKGVAILAARAFGRLTAAQQAAIAAEGEALLGFLHPGATHEVRC